MQDNRTEEKPKKKRKKKKRRKKHYLLRFLLIVALAVGIYYFLTSELFDIQEIIVENNVYYTSEQIIDLAKAKTGGNQMCIRDRSLSSPIS